MCEGAAILVDRVLPRVGYRQWVLSFSGPMAVRLGYDRALLARVSRGFARAVIQSVRRRTRRHHALASVRALHAGVLVVVQRFRYDLGLFVHLHALVTDGAFVEHGDHSVRWLAAPASKDGDLAGVLAAVHRGLGPTGDVDVDVAAPEPGLAACASLSLAGPRPSTDSDVPAPVRPLEVSAFGMSLQAATFLDGRDRRRLERMLRYMLRPPFAHDAVTELPDGRFRLAFKRPSRTGATHVVLEPHRFVARLVGLVPPPGQHQTRYYGVFANHHALRPRILPAKLPELANPPRQLPMFDAAGLAVAAIRRCQPRGHRRRAGGAADR